MARTSGSSAKASTIKGLTSFQSKPPSPLPNGGIATERIPNRFISATNAGSPALMSESRLLPRQCRFVGKLMMYRGFPRRRVSKTNMRPGCTSPRLQAVEYALKLSGKTFLNCRAMPRPIMPTQFTVLTNASTSAVRISPCLNSIMAHRFLVIPIRHDCNGRLVRSSLNGSGYVILNTR